MECPVCGHKEHKPGDCEYENIIHGCICGSCWGKCTCDGKSYTVEEANDHGYPVGGPFTKPGEWLES